MSKGFRIRQVFTSICAKKERILFHLEDAIMRASSKVETIGGETSLMDSI